jgi:hypothetical protein
VQVCFGGGAVAILRHVAKATLTAPGGAMRAVAVARWWTAAACLSLLHGAAAAVNCTLLACPFDCDPVTGCYNACSGWDFNADEGRDVYNPTCAARDVSLFYLLLLCSLCPLLR